MPNLNMAGPFNLTQTEIDIRVTQKSPGNYGLGYMQGNTFIVCYVGRSDTNVNDRLKKHIGELKYKKFYFSYATSPHAAFEKECINYHDFGCSNSLDNSIHPDRPQNTNWKCPRCKIYG